MSGPGALAVLALLVMAGPCLAQQAEPPEPDPSAPSTADAPKSEAPASPEIFIPTEEISEDFAVPFPVDI